jgi:hypothetical protein
MVIDLLRTVYLSIAITLVIASVVDMVGMWRNE